jgi:5-methylthioadenosine/S-adenosylhomocysteine deaminase
MCIFCDDRGAGFGGNEHVQASTKVPSRRLFLKSCAALGTGVGAIPAFAQSSAATDDADLAKFQGSRRVCFRGGLVLTVDRQVGDFIEGDVLVEDGKIRAVGAKLEVSPDDAMILDAKQRIIMPGFVDTHHHFYQGILRSILI